MLVELLSVEEVLLVVLELFEAAPLALLPPLVLSDVFELDEVLVSVEEELLVDELLLLGDEDELFEVEELLVVSDGVDVLVAVDPELVADEDVFEFTVELFFSVVELDSVELLVGEEGVSSALFLVVVC